MAQAFLARLLAARTGVLPISGSMKVGAVDVAISGSLTIAGSDSQSTIVLEAPGGSQTQDSIRVGATEWNRAGDGPWVANPEPVDRSKSLPAFLAGLTSLEDVGVETRDGRQLHHLRPPASLTVSAEALGFATPGVQDATVGVDFWAEADGTPALWSFAIAWRQASGATSVPIQLAMDLDLAGLGRSATVEAPADAWERFTSTRDGYSMAHPAGWTVTQSSGQDTYLLDGTPYVTVAPRALPGSTLDQLHASLLASNETELKAKPETDVAIMLGGQPGRLLTYHFTNAQKQAVYLVDAIAMNGDTGWEVFFTEQAGSEKDDTPVFEGMLSTLTFTR